jgi:hypothetical protein
MTAASTRSVVAGLGAAIAGAATGVAMLGGIGLWFTPAQFIAVTLMFGFPIAAAHVVIVGSIFYAYAKARWPFRWWSAALGGFVTGVTPIMILDTVPLVISLASGRWLEAVGWLSVILWFGCSGVFGGLAFRAIRGRDLAIAAPGSLA